MNNISRGIWIIVISSCCYWGCQKAERVDPIIKSTEAQNIGSMQATLVGELEDLGARTHWDYGFIWSDQPGANINTGNVIYLGNRSMEGTFSALRDGLSPETTYYFKSFVSDPGFTIIYYGNELDFDTLP